MTNTLHFFIESGKLMVMEYVPEEPKKGFLYNAGMGMPGSYEHALERYNEALQKAKQSAIEVDNKEEVKKAIYDADPSRNTGVETYFREGEIYSLEGCRMEVKYKKKYSYMCSDCDTENLHHNKSDQGYCCSFCGSNAKPDLSEAPKVALITFEEPKKEESQEEDDSWAWAELGNAINKMMEPLDDAFGVHPILTVIRQSGKFNITLK